MSAKLKTGAVRLEAAKAWNLTLIIRSWVCVYKYQHTDDSHGIPRMSRIGKGVEDIFLGEATNGNSEGLSLTP